MVVLLLCGIWKTRWGLSLTFCSFRLWRRKKSAKESFVEFLQSLRPTKVTWLSDIYGQFRFLSCKFFAHSVLIFQFSFLFFFFFVRLTLWQFFWPCLLLGSYTIESWCGFNFDLIFFTVTCQCFINSGWKITTPTEHISIFMLTCFKVVEYFCLSILWTQTNLHSKGIPNIIYIQRVQWCTALWG